MVAKTLASPESLDDGQVSHREGLGELGLSLDVWLDYREIPILFPKQACRTFQIGCADGGLLMSVGIGNGENR